MKLRLVILVVSVGLVTAGAWTYNAYMTQLNNTIALQRCVLEIEQEKRATGSLPRSVHCRDYWGEQVAYIVRDGTYVLVSSGSDRRKDANYGDLAPSQIPAERICLTTGADTVFVGPQPVRRCAK